MPPLLMLRLRGGGAIEPELMVPEVGRPEALQTVSTPDDETEEGRDSDSMSVSSSGGGGGGEEGVQPFDKDDMMRRWKEAMAKRERRRTEGKPPDYTSAEEDGDYLDAGKLISTFKWPGYGEDLGGGRWRLVSTRMEINDAGAEYGLFVDIEAKERAVLVTGFKCASHGLSNPEMAYQPIESDNMFQDPLEGLSKNFSATIFTCEGSSHGKELDRSAWVLIAHNDSVALPRVNGKEDWDAEYRERWVGETLIDGEWLSGEPAEPVYGLLPSFEPIRLGPGERRGFLLHTSCEVGIANRWPIHYVPALGEVSDEDANLRLYSSRAMPEEEPFTEEVEWCPDQCAEGLAEGTVDPLEASHISRRREGHCFLGEVLYTVLDE